MQQSAAVPRAPRASEGTRLGSAARHNASLVAGTGVIVLFALAGFAYPVPYNPVAPSGDLLQAPSAAHWFGTSSLGYDVFSRTVWAARQDIPLAAAGTLVSLVLGVPLGLLAGSKGKPAEYVMRGLDVFQAFPLVILAIAVVTLLGNRLSNVIVAIAIINVPRFMRLIRGEALTVRETRFMEAAVAIGASKRRIMRRHLLPNVSTPILVQTSITGANALMVIATLNFLGIGLSPPEPSWGQMIQEGSEFIATGQWWLVAFPSLAIFLVILSLNAIADALRRRIGEAGLR